MTSLPFNNTDILADFRLLTHLRYKISRKTSAQNDVPNFYFGQFVLPQNLTEPQDTFLLPDGWAKVLLKLNDETLPFERLRINVFIILFPLFRELHF